MFSDCHVHCGADARGDAVLRAMDAQGIERMVLIAPHAADSDKHQEDSVRLIAQICAPDTHRLLGFAFLEPTLGRAVEHVRLTADLGLAGVKMIPDHWYPYEERLFPVYRAVEEAGLPLLFHSGILWGNADSSRFCRPVNYEVMLHFPRVRFALAHIGWPWTDECIAVAGRFRADVRRRDAPNQMWVDTTRGTPGFYRKDALDRLLRYMGPEQVLYGSDDRAPGTFAESRRGCEADRAIICEELGWSAADFEKITRTNLDRFVAGPG